MFLNNSSQKTAELFYVFSAELLPMREIQKMSKKQTKKCMNILRKFRYQVANKLLYNTMQLYLFYNCQLHWKQNNIYIFF